MGHLFRSEEMAAVELTILDGAKDPVVLELGAFGKFHPIDLSVTADTEQQARYMQLKKQLHESVLVERRIDELIKLCEEYHVSIPEISIDEKALENLSLHDVNRSLETFHEGLKVQMSIANENRSALAHATEYALVLHYTKSINEEAAVMRQRHRNLLRNQGHGGGSWGRGTGNRGSRDQLVELSPLSSTGATNASVSVENLGLSVSEEDFGPQDIRPRFQPLQYQDLVTPAGSSSRVSGSPMPSPPPRRANDDDEEFGRPRDEESDFLKVEYIAAIARSDDRSAIERVLFRMSRGNAYVQAVPIENPMRDPVTGKYVNMTVMSVIIFGRQLTTRVKRSLVLMGARVYEMPAGRYRPYMHAAEEEIKSYRSMLQATERHIVRRLESLARRVGTSGTDAAEASAKEFGLLSPIRRRSSVTPSESMAVTPGAAAAPRRGSNVYVTLDNEDNSAVSPDVDAPPAPEAMISSPLREFLFVARRERLAVEFQLKAAYTRDGLLLRGWVPRCDLDELKRRIENVDTDGVARPLLSARSPLPNENPPTYFISDKFTSAFQDIVNTYGVPRYREVNPGVYTIITFPFLFGIMFGDIGHGLMLTLVGLVLCLSEDRMKHALERGKLDVFGQFLYQGRYILLMMGIFAFYAGTIYNDLFSIMPDVFGTGYKREAVDNKTELTFTGSVYPWGLDPAWSTASNLLIFSNSFKMKMGIVIGVVHMTFGTLLSVVNHSFFDDTGAIWFEFVPRILFMLSIFGYMSFLIVLKWATHFPDPSTAPSLIQTMINMFLKFGDPGPHPLYEGQHMVQLCLVVIALLTVPVMFFGKPLYLKYKGKLATHDSAHNGNHDDHPSTTDGIVGSNRRAGDAYLSLIGDDDIEEDESKSRLVTFADPTSQDGGGGHGHENETFGDVMIHNAIHTIEFVLGAVSNTASYLRLWALSLAHAQLAHVFWEKMLAEYGYLKSGPMLVVGFAAWFGATVGVLLCMDTLECFLHSLRLHWVEFQNKFFSADGYLFNPFTMQHLAKGLYHSGMSNVLTEEQLQEAEEERERLRVEEEEWNQKRLAMMSKEPAAKTHTVSNAQSRSVDNEILAEPPVSAESSFLTSGVVRSDSTSNIDDESD